MGTISSVHVGLTKAEAFAVRFAVWCQEHGVRPADGGQLLALARRAFKAGERNCNDGTAASLAAEQMTGEAFRLKAEELGFCTEWSGLWPTLRKDGRWIHLPTE